MGKCITVYTGDCDQHKFLDFLASKMTDFASSCCRVKSIPKKQSIPH